MTVDLSKLVMHSNYPAFKNNNIFTGTLTIPAGNTAGGLNNRSFTINLSVTPDLTDIVFNGPANVGSFDPRPSGGWFKQGYIWVPTNNAGGGNPSGWKITTTISGTSVGVVATYVQQFTTVETLTATNFSYRIIDYSVF